VSVDTFCRSFAKDDDETPDEFTQRRFAMKKACRLHMTANNGVPGQAQAIHTHALPFPVNPTSMKVSRHRSESGTRLCHIDLAERRKITKRKVEMMSDKQNGLVPNEAAVKTMKCTSGSLHSSGSGLQMQTVTSVFQINKRMAVVCRSINCLIHLFALIGGSRIHHHR